MATLGPMLVDFTVIMPKNACMSFGSNLFAAVELKMHFFIQIDNEIKTRFTELKLYF